MVKCSRRRRPRRALAKSSGKRRWRSRAPSTARRISPSGSDSAILPWKRAGLGLAKDLVPRLGQQIHAGVLEIVERRRNRRGRGFSRGFVWRPPRWRREQPHRRPCLQPLRRRRRVPSPGSPGGARGRRCTLEVGGSRGRGVSRLARRLIHGRFDGGRRGGGEVWRRPSTCSAWPSSSWRAIGP